MSFITLFHSCRGYYRGNNCISRKYPRSVDIFPILRKISMFRGYYLHFVYIFVFRGNMHVPWILSAFCVYICISLRLSASCGNIHVLWILSAFCVYIRISWKYPRSVHIINISWKYPRSVDIIRISWKYLHFVYISVFHRDYPHFVEISTFHGYYPHFVYISVFCGDFRISWKYPNSVYIIRISSFLSLTFYSSNERDLCNPNY